MECIAVQCSSRVVILSADYKYLLSWLPQDFTTVKETTIPFGSMEAMELVEVALSSFRQALQPPIFPGLSDPCIPHCPMWFLPSLLSPVLTYGPEEGTTASMEGDTGILHSCKCSSYWWRLQSWNVGEVGGTVHRRGEYDNSSIPGVGREVGLPNLIYLKDNSTFIQKKTNKK